MGGWEDDAAVQRKAQLRLLSALPVLWLQDSAERVDAPGIAHHPVPEVRRSVRRDGWPEAHQHVLNAALPTAEYTGVEHTGEMLYKTDRRHGLHHGGEQLAFPALA
jgi:hypothetical protein